MIILLLSINALSFLLTIFCLVMWRDSNKHNRSIIKWQSKIIEEQQELLDNYKKQSSERD